MSAIRYIVGPQQIQGRWMNRISGSSWGLIFCLVVFTGLGMRASAQQGEGAAIYKRQCALCHDNSAMTRAPSRAALKMMSPENTLRALETGRMKDQGSLLTAAQRR